MWHSPSPPRTPHPQGKQCQSCYAFTKKLARVECKYCGVKDHWGPPIRADEALVRVCGGFKGKYCIYTDMWRVYLRIFSGRNRHTYVYFQHEIEAPVVSGFFGPSVAKASGGVREGDVLVAVNHRDTTTLSFEKVVC